MEAENERLRLEVRETCVHPQVLEDALVDMYALGTRSHRMTDEEHEARARQAAEDCIRDIRLRSAVKRRV